jgi:hypothetical protein
MQMQHSGDNNIEQSKRTTLHHPQQHKHRQRTLNKVLFVIFPSRGAQFELQARVQGLGVYKMFSLCDGSRTTVVWPTAPDANSA